jgi:hypothetical protein
MHALMKTSLIQRVRARAPAYWPLMREEPFWAVMFVFSRINAARRLERLISSAGHKAPKEVTHSVFEGLDLQKAVSTLIDQGVYQGLCPPASCRR